MVHNDSHPMAGKTVALKCKSGEWEVGQEYRVEDWWDKISGSSWMFAQGNPACLKYAMRSGFAKPPLPTDDEVVYGKIGGLGHLIHVSELGDEQEAPNANS